MKQYEFHPHLLARMSQRGVTKEEVEKTMIEGWAAGDAKSGTSGKTFIFVYNDKWEGKFYKKKEVTVYYKLINNNVVLLTVKARYGKDFPAKGGAGK